MFALVVVAALGASPSVPKLAIVPFKTSQLSPELSGFAEDRLSAELAKRGVQVISPSDVEGLLGLERQRQLLGCSDEAASCMAELTAALGIELVVMGRLTRLGERFEADLRVIRQSNATVAARSTQAVDGEAKLGALLEASAAELVRQLEPKAPATPVAWRLWGPAAAGVVLAAAGATGWVLAEQRFAAYTRPGGEVKPLASDAVPRLFSELSVQRGVSIAGVIAGLASVAAGIVWNSLAPTVTVTNDAVSVGLGGRL